MIECNLHINQSLVHSSGIRRCCLPTQLRVGSLQIQLDSFIQFYIG